MTVTVDGWQIGRTETGRWRAVRRTPLDERELAYGCAAFLVADSKAEIELLVVAEDIKSSVIAAAWRLVSRMAEVDRRLTEDVAGGAVRGDTACRVAPPVT